MGATYTRQSTYADGDTITADHTNDEFDQLLAAFAASTGHTHDGTAGEGGPISSFGSHAITFGSGTSGTDISVNFDGESNDGLFKWMEDEDYFEFSDDLLIASTEKIQFRDTAIYLNSSADGQLDIVADTEVQIAATTVDINGAVDISGNLSIGGNLDVTGTFDLSDSNFTNAGDIQLDSISGDGDTNTSITFSGSDVITFTNGGETQLTFNNGSILPTTDNDIDLGSSSLEFKDLYIDGTAHLDAINFNGTVIASTAAELNILDGVTATAAELNILDGVTSTAAELNILDVSNSTIGDLTEISTAANDDVLIALDTSGGGIKKITRSTFLAGSGSSSDIANVVEDTSPQLGGNLDMNGADIVTTSNATLDLAPNGTGTVVVRGNTNSGAIVFNCESNTHGQKVIAQPHPASVTNTMLLPAGANSTLVSLVSTDTLTNKTLTSPKINEDVAVTSTATELNVLDGITAVVGELNALDLGSTAVGTAIASKAVILDSNKDYTGIRNLTISGEIDAATGDFSGAVDVAGALTNGSTLVSTGKITADAGIDIDNFNIDGTTIALSSGDMVLDGAADIILDAAGGDFKFKVGGTEILNITNSSSDVIIKPIVDAKDIIFQQRDGTEVARIEDNGTFNVVTDKLAINGTAVTSTAAELNQLDGVVAKTAGKETIWVPASAMQPTKSNGCSSLQTVETTSGRPDLVVLDFDKDSDEFAQFSVAFPVSWNAGTVTFQVFWAGIAATTDVDWMVDAVAISNNTTIDVAYGTAVVVTDNAQGAVEELNVSAESGAVTIAGSPGDDELCFFRIGRDVSGDGMAGDARLVGIKLFFTTDLANDG